MATAKNKRGASTRIKRADRKNISVGQAHIRSTFNNTIVSITDPAATSSLGSPLVPWASRVPVSRPRLPPRWPPSLRQGRYGARYAQGRRLREGPRFGPRDRDPLPPAAGLEVSSIQDKTPIPHNAAAPRSVAACN